jgi:hypothetical protein
MTSQLLHLSFGALNSWLNSSLEWNNWSQLGLATLSTILVCSMAAARRQVFDMALEALRQSHAPSI